MTIDTALDKPAKKAPCFKSPCCRYLTVVLATGIACSAFELAFFAVFTAPRYALHRAGHPFITPECESIFAMATLCTGAAMIATIEAAALTTSSTYTNALMH